MIEFPDATQCLFPMGDPRESRFRFCAEKAEPGKRYCAFHCARCYLPAEPNKQPHDSRMSTIQRVFGGRA